ncbi:hypothetical protein SNE40_004067 [Patella caerulea]|uniref:EGF-like domain-containing protein n=1 Tax=Patella caerulea TaxID=87958 RepID=A0AAN8KJP1_PATCE
MHIVLNSVLFVVILVLASTGYGGSRYRYSYSRHRPVDPCKTVRCSFDAKCRRGKCLCGDVACSSGAICINGNCACPPGYGSGPNCSIPEECSTCHENETCTTLSRGWDEATRGPCNDYVTCDGPRSTCPFIGCMERGIRCIDDYCVFAFVPYFMGICKGESCHDGSIYACNDNSDCGNVGNCTFGCCDYGNNTQYSSCELLYSFEVCNRACIAQFTFQHVCVLKSRLRVFLQEPGIYIMDD